MFVKPALIAFHSAAKYATAQDHQGCDLRESVDAVFSWISHVGFSCGQNRVLNPVFVLGPFEAQTFVLAEVHARALRDALPHRIMLVLSTGARAQLSIRFGSWPTLWIEARS